MKNILLNETHLSQVDRRTEALRSTKDQAQVRGGWIRYMRVALGLTMQELAHRLALPASNIAQAEKRECAGAITLATLQKIAHAMECELVYSFVPNKDIRTLINDKAMEKARHSLRNADVHMGLENQSFVGDEEERVKRLAKKFIEKGDIW